MPHVVLEARFGALVPVPCGEDLEAEASTAAEGLEAEFTPERLRELVANGGFASA